jgi:penicillin-binding protein 1A
MRTLLRAFLLIALLSTIVLSGCSMSNSPSDSVPVMATTVADANVLTDDQLITLVRSNQITFSGAGGKLEPVCSCGPRIYFNEISPIVVKALIAVEDRNFGDHSGFDLNGTMRALLKSIGSLGKNLQGGSTLTAQLVKNTVLTQGQEIDRKLAELDLAGRLEGLMSKKKILESYLNGVIYGFLPGGKPIVGIADAAKFYFGRSPDDLDLLQAAILAGSVQAPSKYNYLTKPEATLKRARVVLAAMVEEGYITAEEMDEALASKRSRGKQEAAFVETRSFVEWVLAAVRKAYPDLVIDTSTRIPITLQMITQFNAEQAFKDGVDAVGIKAVEGAYIAAAFDGRVVALVGQRDFSESQINFAMRTHSQPASSFKPIVYAAAIEAKKVKVSSKLKTAMAVSDNDVARKLARSAGYDAVVDMAQQLGITAELRADDSIALGGSEVSLAEMVSAYIPFANAGIGAQLYGYYGVIQRGKVVGWMMPKRPRTLSSTLADTMKSLLRQVVIDPEGTGKAARVVEFAAGKTGSSNENKDAWWVGFNDRHVSGLWIGRPDNKPMPGVSGKDAVKIWTSIEKALPDEL